MFVVSYVKNFKAYPTNNDNKEGGDMSNIGIHGFEKSEAIRIRGLVINCMQKIGLGSEAIWEIFPTTTGTCDGKNNPAPYLHVFSSEYDHIPVILRGFQDFGPHCDTEINDPRRLSGRSGFFFTKKEIVSGSWRKKFFGTEDLSSLVEEILEGR